MLADLLEVMDERIVDHLGRNVSLLPSCERLQKFTECFTTTIPVIRIHTLVLK
jgi:hypothetical protein